MNYPSSSTIAIEGIDIYAYHGVYARERDEGNHFVVDVYLQAPVLNAAASDQLDQTVDYQQVYQLVLDRMTQPSHLLETLVYDIGSQVLTQFPPVVAARIRVTKQRPLAMEQCARTYVEGHFVREEGQGVGKMVG